MGKAQPVFTQQYRDDAAQRVLESGRPIAEVARSLGIHANTLGKWVTNARSSSNGDEKTILSSEQAKIQELEKENSQLRRDNDFLKKAAAWFASLNK